MSKFITNARTGIVFEAARTDDGVVFRLTSRDGAIVGYEWTMPLNDALLLVHELIQSIFANKAIPLEDRERLVAYEIDCVVQLLKDEEDGAKASPKIRRAPAYPVH